MAVAAVSFGERARQAVRVGPPHCTGPSGFLAVLASGGVRTNSPAAQTCAALIHLRLRSSAEHRGGPTRTTCRAPVFTRRAVLFAEVSRENAGCFQSRRSLRRMPNERAHVGGWFALGRQSSLRRAPQRKADQGRTCLSRRRVCADPAFREEHREVRRTGGSAAPRQTTRRRPRPGHRAESESCSRSVQQKHDDATQEAAP